MIYNYWLRHTCNIPLYETATRRQLATIITAAAHHNNTKSRREQGLTPDSGHGDTNRTIPGAVS